MKKDTVKLVDPVFSDYVYSILYNLSFEDKIKLPRRYDKLLRSETAAKNFCNKSSYDEKLQLLTYLGYKHCTLVVNNDGPDINGFREIFEKFKNRHIYSLRQITDNGVYVTSNKQLVELLCLMAQTIHHKVFKQQLEYTRTGYHIQGWSKRLNNGADLAKIDLEQRQSAFIVKTFSSLDLTFKRCHSIFKMREEEMRVLLYLFPYSNTYTDISIIKSYFTGVIADRGIASSIKHLVHSGHIQIHPSSNKYEYTITDKGVMLTHKFMEAVYNSNTFN